MSGKISIFPPDATNWTGNGQAILFPTSCEVTETAGGEYELELVHPCDEWGKWKYLVTDAIIKVPVPVQNVPAITPQDVAYWRVKTDVTADVIVYAKPLIYTYDSASSYAAWSASTIYYKGNYVSMAHASGTKAYRYVGPNGYLTEPPGTTSTWEEVSQYDSSRPGHYTGGGQIGQIYAGDIFVKLSTYNADWMRVRIADGIEGYIKSIYCEYYGEVTEAFPARSISEQCFRIYQVATDSEDMSVTVSARHISYDLYAIMVGSCEVNRATPSTALTILQASTLIEDVRTMATNISAYPVTADWSWNNAIYALLDEDVGMVHLLKAKLIRDNNDFFILQNDEVDNGFSIEYGNNLIGVNWSFNVEGVITRILPKAEASDGTTLLLPEKYIDSILIDDYPVARMTVLDTGYKVGDQTTDETGHTVTLTENDVYRLMRRDAMRMYNLDEIDLPEFSLDVEFVNLGDTVEYQQYKGLQLLAMYDTVRIKHSMLDFVSKMQLKGYQWDCISERYTSAHFDGYFASVDRDELMTRPETAMTSEHQDGCYVSASSKSQYANTAFRGFDFSVSTSWNAASTDTTPWLQIQMDVALKDVRVYVYSRDTSSFSHPKAGYVQGSNDGSTWTTIGTFSDWPKVTGDLVGIVECGNAEAYSYIRLTTTATSANTQYMAIGYMYVTGRGRL